MSNERKMSPEELSNYLSAIPGVRRYVISSEGLPIYWSSGLTQQEAEELTALGTDLMFSIKKFFKKNLIAANVIASSRNTSVIEVGNLLTVIEGIPEIVSKVLENISKWSVGGVRCPWCGIDLSKTPINCPKCGKHLPFGLNKCPYCGATIYRVNCPKCSNLVSPSGNKVIATRDKLSMVLGLVILGVAGTVIALSLSTGNLAGIIVSLIASGVLGAVSINLFRVKTFREELNSGKEQAR